MKKLFTLRDAVYVIYMILVLRIPILWYFKEYIRAKKLFKLFAEN
jgi:hypothetical protein